jgi:hypothetical protein
MFKNLQRAHLEKKLLYRTLPRIQVGSMLATCKIPHVPHRFLRDWWLNAEEIGW